MVSLFWHLMSLMLQKANHQLGALQTTKEGAENWPGVPGFVLREETDVLDAYGSLRVRVQADVKPSGECPIDYYTWGTQNRHT